MMWEGGRGKLSDAPHNMPLRPQTGPNGIFDGTACTSAACSSEQWIWPSLTARSHTSHYTLVPNSQQGGQQYVSQTPLLPYGNSNSTDSSPSSNIRSSSGSNSRSPVICPTNVTTTLIPAIFLPAPTFLI